MIAINQRYVSSTLITGAVRAGVWHPARKRAVPRLPSFPLQIDTGLVDVNVHPTKKLVRLSREKEIARAMSEAVKTALLSNDLIPDAAAPSQIYLEESGRKLQPYPTRVMTSLRTAPYGISEALHAGTVMTDRQLRQTELPTGMVPVDAKLPVMEVIGAIGRDLYPGHNGYR